MRTTSISILLSLLILSVAAPYLAQEPVTATPAAPAPYLASGPRELFAKGVELADRGAVQEAKTIFKALTLAYPDLPEPHINLAVLLAAEGGTEESAQAAEAAMRAHPLCRAAFDLDFQRQIGPFGATLLDAVAPAPVAAPTPAPSPAPPVAAPPAARRPAALPVDFGDATRVVTADPCLNFRPLPEATALATECLPPGTRVRWLETAGDWTRVALRDGREGWMATAFLTPIEP